MKLLQNVSRRAFIRGIFPAGALVIGASLLPESLWACATTSHAGAGTVPRPNLFVGIQADDTVWIVASRSEMGTGTGTALPMILADELDADWTKVEYIRRTATRVTAIKTLTDRIRCEASST